MPNCSQEWGNTVERLLHGPADAEEVCEPGPDTELEYWRKRMAQLSSITEQLRSRESKLVLGVCNAARTAGHKRWKALDLRVSASAGRGEWTR
jgi:dynein heavy chain